MDPPASKKPAICHNLWGWQHSSRGKVSGISGYVDMDICYTKVTSSGIVQSTTAYYPRYTGTSGSIVAALNAVGVNSSYAIRKLIAKENGITGYVGSAKQNTQMLTLLKSGKLKRIWLTIWDKSENITFCSPILLYVWYIEIIILKQTKKSTRKFVGKSQKSTL